MHNTIEMCKMSVVLHITTIAQQLFRCSVSTCSSRCNEAMLVLGSWLQVHHLCTFGFLFPVQDAFTASVTWILTPHTCGSEMHSLSGSAALP